MAWSPAQRVIAQSLPLGCHLGPLLNLDPPSNFPRTGQPLHPGQPHHPLTTTAKNHYTTKPPSNLQTYLDVMSSSSAAHLVALDPCQLDLVNRKQSSHCGTPVKSPNVPRCHIVFVRGSSRRSGSLPVGPRRIQTVSLNRLNSAHA